MVSWSQLLLAGESQFLKCSGIWRACHGGSIYTTEISKCYKSELLFVFPGKLFTSTLLGLNLGLLNSLDLKSQGPQNLNSGKLQEMDEEVNIQRNIIKSRLAHKSIWKEWRVPNMFALDSMFLYFLTYSFGSWGENHRWRIWGSLKNQRSCYSS